jgi:hypothetical protein
MKDGMWKIKYQTTSDFNHLISLRNPANLGPMLGSQALPVTSQAKVVSDTGVTPL